MSNQFVTVLTGTERLQSPPDRPSSSYTGDTCQYEINGAQKSLYTKRWQKDFRSTEAVKQLSSHLFLFRSTPRYLHSTNKEDKAKSASKGMLFSNYWKYSWLFNFFSTIKNMTAASRKSLANYSYFLLFQLHKLNAWHEKVTYLEGLSN